MSLKPPPNSVLNLDHPLANGLFYGGFFLEGTGTKTRNFADGVDDTVYDPVWSTNAYGTSLRCPNGYIEAGTCVPLGDKTFAIVSTISALSTRQDIIDTRGSTGSVEWHLRNGNLQFDVIGKSGPAFTVQNYVDGMLACLLVTHDQTTARFYQDGVFVAAAGAGAIDGNRSGAVLGDIQSTGVGRDEWLGDASCVCTWDRILTDTEIAAFATDPFGMLRVQPRAYAVGGL